MKNLFKVFGIIALTAIIGFGFVACGPGAAGGDPDPIALSVIIGDSATATEAVTTADTDDTLYAVCATEGVTYKWTANGVVIATATTASYKVAAGDAGKQIEVTVSKAKVDNQAYTDATSGKVTVSGDLAAIALEVIIGDTATATTKVTTAETGDTLYAVCETEGVTYQWKLDDLDVTGATGASYVTTAAGKVTVTVSKADVYTQKYTADTSDEVTVSDPSSN